jgi:hypothetical protein
MVDVFRGDGETGGVRGGTVGAMRMSRGSDGREHI